MPKEQTREVLKFPSLIAFVSSFCLMVLELVAGRLMAPYLGVSLYTWTSIIGIILAGISLGNYLGGRLADQKLSRQILGSAFFLAGISSAAVLYLVPALGTILGKMNLPLALSTFLFSLVIFFPASLFLGCISPMVIKFDLKNLEKTGRTVGKIYAMGTLGSILGTFATGFFLIALFSTKFVVIGISAVLIILGIIVFGQGQGKGLLKDKANIIFSLIFVGSFFLPQTCDKETNYYCIKASAHTAEEGTAGYSLKLDHLIHSFVYPGREEILTYEYEKLYKFLTDYWINDNGKSDFSALFLGGGGYTLPRYFEKNYLGSNLEVAEIDPGVTNFNYQKLSLNPETKIKTINQDARIYLQRLPADQKYDLIFGDAFNDFSVPYHLTTLEFGKVVKEHLAPGGFYAVNVIDDYQYGKFVSSFVKTLEEIFPHVYLAPLATDWQKDRRNTFVVLAGEEPINEDQWAAVLKVLEQGGQYSNMDKASYLVSKDETQKFLEEKGAIVLTDDYVPTDNLLAPVFNYAY
ncbi:fused MFS/spermidine synthase [Candidatus Falkowbacteria bacterium]|nr:fused MFS/spermidine synthase [Candidatus Falkowbacteria bacterium]